MADHQYDGDMLMPRIFDLGSLTTCDCSLTLISQD